MVPPELMCRAHLLGEHRELHALAGMIRAGRSLDGYVAKALICTGDLAQRHEDLAQEMFYRGYRHNSPLHLTLRAGVGRVDVDVSMSELRRRCGQCRERMSGAETRCG